MYIHTCAMSAKRNRGFIEKLMVPKTVKKFLDLYEIRRCTTEPSGRSSHSCSKPYEPSSHRPNLFP